MSARRDGSFVLSIILFVIAVTGIPYLLAATTAAPDFAFGGFLLNPIDGNSYLAKMQLGWQGEWLFTLPYSSEPGAGALLFTFYIFLGHLSRLTGLPLLITFHLVRLVSLVVMLLALHRFLRAVFPDPAMQRMAFGLAALGSGMGWLALPLGSLTSDFWVAEAYPFLSAYANPHFPLGLALLLSILTLPNRAAPGADWHSGLLGEWPAGIAAFLLALVSPFGVVIALMVLGAFAALEALSPNSKNRIPPGDSIKNLILGRFAWVLLGGGPLLLNYSWVAASHPQLSAWNAQNLTPSPPMWDLVLSLSPALILALPGGWWAVRRGNAEQRILVVWAVLGLLLMYLPLGLQRRFIQGLYVPLVGLAVLGVALLTQPRARVYKSLVIALFALALPTNLIILMLAGHGIQTRDPWLYLSAGESQALSWLATHTPQEALVLAAPQTGLFIPAHSGRRVFYGHPFETIDAERRAALVRAYFIGDPESEAGLLLDRADYVFVGPRERALSGGAFDPGWPVTYRNEDVSIYAVAR